MTMQRKSAKKRIRVTRTGKILRRTSGICHFRTRKSSKTLRNKKPLRAGHKNFLKY